MKRNLKKVTVLIICLFTIVPSASAVTRGETLHRVMEALSLPQWTGNSFSDVPQGHPYGKSIESAFALGILFPSDQFYPDLPASRVEALAFAFMAMGWTHTAKTLSLYHDLPKDIPPYLAPYLFLAQTAQPQAPEEFVRDPKGTVGPQDLARLSMWLKSCLSQGITWTYQQEISGMTLVVGKEGVGRPPQEWVISVAEKDSEQEANQLIKSLKSRGISAKAIKLDGSISVTAGPYGNYFQAWLVSQALPSPYKGAPVIPQGGEKKSLFWAAIKGPAFRSQIATAPSLGAKSLPLSQIATESRAIGAVNGGFFGSNRPIGTMVVDGIPVSPTHADRSSVGWNERGEVFFGNGNFRLFGQTEKGQEFPIAGINQPIKDGALALYTPHFGQFATQIKGGGTGFFLTKTGKIISKINSAQSNHFMGEDKLILLAKTAGTGPLEEGTDISLKIRWKDRNMQEASQVIQAGPMLAGSLSQEGFSPSIIEKRHPRTIVGWDGQNLWWIAVDGRSSWHSDGLTIPEASDFARRLGLTYALNMDGGGSTQIWWNGNTVNRPSDGRERPLPYGVIFR